MTPDECKRYVQFIDGQELELTPTKKRGEAVRVNCESWPLHHVCSCQRNGQPVRYRQTIRDLNRDGRPAALAARPASPAAPVPRLAQAGRLGRAAGALVQLEHPDVQVHAGPAFRMPLRRRGARPADGGTVGVDAARISDWGGRWREGR